MVIIELTSDSGLIAFDLDLFAFVATVSQLTEPVTEENPNPGRTPVTTIILKNGAGTFIVNETPEEVSLKIKDGCARDARIRQRTRN